MLDPRIYRAGLAPVMVALIVAAFSLRDEPAPIRTTLAAEAFDGERAMRELSELAERFPARRPGSAGDEALAGYVADAMRAPEVPSGEAGQFEVTTHRDRERTIDGTQELTTVIARRTGLSTAQVVVVAHRDAARAPSTAELSATAALLELSRVFVGRTMRRTLVLASTSGGSGGAGGASALASHIDGPVAAVVVLGDLAGQRVRKPLVVPWSNDGGIAPAQLVRTLESALSEELEASAGAHNPLAQFARLAFPFTPGEQGAILAGGLPSAQLSVSGEQGPVGAEEVGTTRLDAFGRAALRAVTALGDSPQTPGPPERYLTIQRKLLPEWAVRLFAGALLIPLLLLAGDAIARARRQGERILTWLRWVLCGAIPFVVALVFARLLGLAGLIDPALEALPPREAVPVDAQALVAIASVALVLLVGILTLRPVALRMADVPSGRPGPGSGVAVLLAGVVLASLVWLINPYAAMVILPALHLWLPLISDDARLGRGAAYTLIAAGLAPLASIGIYAMLELGYGPLEALWAPLLVLAGGSPGAVQSLVWSLLAGVAWSFGVLAAARPRSSQEAEITVRGPSSYAGPGSLGGTDSALGR